MRLRDIGVAALLILLAVAGGSLVRDLLASEVASPPPVVAEVGRHKHDNGAPLVDDLVPVVAPECHAATLAEVQAKLSPLAGITWVWADLPDSAAGYAYAPNVIAMDPSVDCGWVPSIALHEWMHLATWEAYGEYPHGSENGETVAELVADCGSELLGKRFGYPTYTNYANRAGGCSTAVVAHVRHILETV
jgi:hypothetical protein